ncbi:MAG: signal peptidase II [Candidatus Berkelbacteria bacterium]|nr:signal peptidase II [Candidatus Berkelbacteria bacterium]
MISRHKYWFFSIFAFIFFILCQFISWLVYKSDQLVFKNEKIVFFFAPPYLLLLMSVAIFAFIIFSIFELKKNSNNSIIFSLTLILGGGLSNFIDRILKGGVADYLDLIYWKMNLADILIFIGIFLFFFNLLRRRQEKRFF